MPRNTILVGDATVQLRMLPTASVDCVITSPPYFLLRDYQVVGQLGLEDTVEEWVRRLRDVMDEVARIVKPSGSVWLNLGDSYSHHARFGAAPRSLFMAPERLALGLMEDGWIVRNKIIWHKSNPMPASVGNRLTNSYDVVYFLTRSPQYFFDLDAIREPHTTTAGSAGKAKVGGKRPEWSGPFHGTNSGLKRPRPGGIPGCLVGRNPGDVWRLAAANYRGAHFATFPESLIERPLLATCPLRVCSACGVPWQPGPGKTYILGKREPIRASLPDHHVRRYPSSWRVLRQPGPLVIGCGCQAPSQPGVVLDPFMGSGTTAVLAERWARDWVGIELNPDYVEMAWRRLGRAGPEEQAA